MKKKQIKIHSFFPVELILYENEKVLLKDIQENVYEIRTKEGFLLTKEQYQNIIDNNMGFWQIAHQFRLTIGEYTV